MTQRAIQRIIRELEVLGELRNRSPRCAWSENSVPCFRPKACRRCNMCVEHHRRVRRHRMERRPNSDAPGKETDYD